MDDMDVKQSMAEEGYPRTSLGETAIKAPAAVEAAVAAIAEQADSLSKRTAILEERLGDVLRGELDGNVPYPGHESTGVPLADHLLGLADCLSSVSARLNELFHRVEL